LRRCIVLFRGFLVPLERFRVIVVDTFAFFVSKAEFVLRLRIAAFGGIAPLLDILGVASSIWCRGRIFIAL